MPSRAFAANSAPGFVFIPLAFVVAFVVGISMIHEKIPSAHVLGQSKDFVIDLRRRKLDDTSLELRLEPLNLPRDLPAALAAFAQEFFRMNGLQQHATLGGPCRDRRLDLVETLDAAQISEEKRRTLEPSFPIGPNRPNLLKRRISRAQLILEFQYHPGERAGESHPLHDVQDPTEAKPDQLWPIEEDLVEIFVEFLVRVSLE